ncbi:hypothetical protein [Candidatus Lokiarchaeum ossiferum]|uniref:hypothetical protein n=1 Tax=Candidatus Lokiarchaeum ossiferum TaxID=2951803 RepID=UPI00352BF701
MTPKKICPSCKEEFTPIYPTKAEAMTHPLFTPDGRSDWNARIGREEHISGLCAKCQKKLFGDHAESEDPMAREGDQEN